MLMDRVTISVRTINGDAAADELVVRWLVEDDVRDAVEFAIVLLAKVVEFRLKLDEDEDAEEGEEEEGAPFAN